MLISGCPIFTWAQSRQARGVEIYWNLIWKSPGFFFPFGANLTLLSLQWQYLCSAVCTMTHSSLGLVKPFDISGCQFWIELDYQQTLRNYSYDLIKSHISSVRFLSGPISAKSGTTRFILLLLFVVVDLLKLPKLQSKTNLHLRSQVLQNSDDLIGLL